MRAALLLAFAAAVAGCGEGPDPGGDAGSDAAGVVAGVSSPLRVGVDILSLHVSTWVDGKPTRDMDVASDALKLPMELDFGSLSPGALAKAEVSAFGSNPSNPLVVRRAATNAVAGRRILLPVPLEPACVPTTSGGSAPMCDEPETCAGGQCRSTFVSPDQLDDYDPAWASVPDVCKPSGGGDPIVIVGKGQSDYLPVADGDVLQVEAGPQGGYHVWLAVRLKNLHQSGSITAASGHFPDLGFDTDPLKVVFTFDQDEGGYCKLYGIRLVVANDMAHVSEVLGQKVDVTITVTDKDGDVGTGKKSIVLSNDFI